ncbi:MAG: FkbM family methyltransferase [Proteobacteria bacterium]|nr:FkbM family methyltransferase [Candidatus Fonsibacter sp. PEL4]NBZ97948.1 FkbM family methyltransferase [Candidatus Fonsibacter sp. PEL4]
MKQFDFGSLDKKNINEIINIADNLSKQNLEDKLNAYKIYQSIIQLNQIPNIYQFPNTHLRGAVHQKIYELEKVFNLNEYFFSQAGQDKFINNLFFRGMKNGFFVEIGAYNGIDGSNCYFFEKFLNWSGLAIEPSPSQFLSLQKNRRCKCINKAVAKKSEKIEFIDVIEGYTQMSGINNSSYQKTLEIIKKDLRTVLDKKIIQAATFSEIVEYNYLIDYLSIDVEGGEMDILESIDFNLYKIKVLSVENNYPNEINYEKYLSEKGFNYIDNVGVDEIYFNKKYLTNLKF